MATPPIPMTPLQLDQIQDRRDLLDGLDIWADGEDQGDQIRADLDALLGEIERLMLGRKS